MEKKYTIEVPIYSNPLPRLIEINHDQDIGIIMYGGVPDSPFNGGRLNYCLDGVDLNNRSFPQLDKDQLEKISEKFFRTVEEANRNGLPFFYALTNMYVSAEELNEKNLQPLHRLVKWGQTYGVKNGAILYNGLLEDRVRRLFGDQLTYVSSCTKYVSPLKILSPAETLDMYIRDSERYDYVVMTPQDSRRESQIKRVLAASRCPVIAICNSYCSYACNSYYHYDYSSKENKKSLLRIRLWDILTGSCRFFIPRAFTCSAVRLMFRPVDLENITRMQLAAGITHFKLGRGYGSERIDQLVALLKGPSL